MSFLQAWYQSVRTRRQVMHWAAEGHLDEEGVKAALRALGDPPDAQQWRRFWLLVCAWLGALLLGAAAISLIAANWSGLGRGARLGLAQGALVLAALMAWLAPRQRAVFVPALWLASVLIGVVLALIGQTYQLGADPWQMFALWAVLMLPWALAARHASLWLLFVVLANLALALALGTLFEGNAGLLAVVLINVCMLLVWERVLRHHPQAVAGRTGPRLIGAVLLAITSLYTFADWGTDDRGQTLPWLLWLGAVLMLAWRYQRPQRDLMIVALSALAIIVVLTAQVALRLFEIVDDIVLVSMPLALAVLAQASLATRWLHRLAREGDSA